MEKYERYEVDKELLKDVYYVYDTSESRYIAEKLTKADAELIANALNKSR